MAYPPLLMRDAVAVVTIMFTDTALVTIMSVGTMAADLEKYGAARHNAASGADATTMTMVTTIVGQDIADEERQRRSAILEVGARSVGRLFARFAMTAFETKNLADNDLNLVKSGRLTDVTTVRL